MSKAIGLAVVVFLVINFVFASKVLADDKIKLAYDNNEVLKIVSKVIPHLDNSSGYAKLRTEDLSKLKITQDQLVGLNSGLKSNTIRVSKECPSEIKNSVTSLLNVNLGVYITFTPNSIPVTSGYLASIVIRSVSLLCPGESTLYAHSGMVVTKSSLYATLSIIMSTYTAVDNLFVNYKPVTLAIPLNNVLMGLSGSVGWFGRDSQDEIAYKSRYIIR